MFTGYVLRNAKRKKKIGLSPPSPPPPPPRHPGGNMWVPHVRVCLIIGGEGGIRQFPCVGYGNYVTLKSWAISDKDVGQFIRV